MQVVKIKRKNGLIIQDCDVYIGRACFMGGWKLPKSKWANPYTIADCGSAEVAIAKYREYIVKNPELMASLGELHGRLGCWCHPGPCHGDVLVELVRENEKKPENKV